MYGTNINVDVVNGDRTERPILSDAPRQNQALLAKFCSAQEPKMHGARSNCRKSVNDGIEQRNYPAFHKSIYIS